MDSSTRWEGSNPWLLTSSVNEVSRGTWRILGSATNVPTPCAVRISPSAASSASAWRMVERETP